MKIKRRKFITSPANYNPERPIDELLANNEEKYLLVNLIASRARDLNEGARALVKIDGPATLLDIAFKEAQEGKLKVGRREIVPVEGEEAESSEEDTE